MFALLPLTCRKRALVLRVARSCQKLIATVDLLREFSKLETKEKADTFLGEH